MVSASPELVAKFPDVDPFLLLKWERLYHLFFDRNANETVDWGDFYLVVRHVRDIYGADSTQMTYARSSMKALWAGLLEFADANQDKKIEMDEWIKVIKSSDTESKWFLEYLTFMFKLFDVSADGVLDLAEYCDGMVAHCVDIDDAKQAFQIFAKDKNGKAIHEIDFLTFKEFWHQYFKSTDKKAPGNWLFGMLEMEGV